MKKNYAFALMALVLLGATSLAFAQNSEAVEKMTGVRGIALRTYCSFANLFGAKSDRCFTRTQVVIGNTASVGAAGVLGNTSGAPTPGSTPVGNQGGQIASVGGFAVQTSPQIIERTVIVQGTPGPQGPAGAPGAPGAGATGAFINVPQVFWNGGGGSASPSFAPISPLPSGALPGQVLATNASGTVEWQYITIPSASNTPSILGSLANLFGINGVNLATTSTSTTIKLGGPLTEDTNITQGIFNFGLARNGFGIVNQGTTTVSVAGGTLENSNFAGLTATEGSHSLFAGMFRRVAPGYPLFEVQAFDADTNQQGYSAVGNSTAQIGVTNGTTTNQLRADAGKIRLSSNTTGASSSQIRIDGDGVHFGFDANATNNGKTYSFPRTDGPFDGVMATDALGQLRFRTLLEILSTTSTSTLAQMPLWSTTGNTGTNPTDNFLGTIDTQDLVVKTDNTERVRFTSAGNVGIGTTTPNNRLSIEGNANVSGYFGVGTNSPARPLTVEASPVGRIMGLFINNNPGNQSGIALGATRPNGNVSTRWGMFVNPRNNADDRFTVYAYGEGGIMTLTKYGDSILAKDSGFNPLTDTVPARLSVFANDARPTAVFQNGDQSYLQINNNAGAFPQSYKVGVEAVGGTFNIIDANTSQTRLSINRNGGVQIYDRLAVGSYDFGLGDVGDAGFGVSSEAYMRYVQARSVDNPRLELYDSQNNLSTVISQSSNGTDTEFNRTNKDIDFRIAGQSDNNLFFADASTNRIGIGTNTPGFKIDSVITTGGNNGFRQTSTDSTALGLVRLQNNTGAISQLSVYGSNHFLPEFRNNGGVGASNDFYIYSDSETASGGTHSINFMTGGYTPSTQTRMRITGAGNVGIGTLTPSTRLEVNSGVANDSGFTFTQLTSASPAVGTELQFLTLDASGKVILSDLDPSVFATTSPAGVNGSVQFNENGLFAADTNFTWDNTNNRLGLGTNIPSETLDVSGNINISNGSAYKYGGANVITANPALSNYFFGGSGNLAMTGNDNTAVGYRALRDNTTGVQNTAMGAEALRQNTTGSHNSAFSQDALRANVSGDSNVALGVEALRESISGSSNVAIGVGTLVSNISGSVNTVVGHNSGLGIVTGSNNTILGANVTGLAAGLSNNIIIADGVGTRRINIDASGNTGIGTITPTERLDVAGNVRFSGALMPAGLPGSLGSILMSQGPGVAPMWTATTSLGFIQGVTSINGLTSMAQTFVVDTAGTDFTISSLGSTHTFSLPSASATNRGALTSADWTMFNNKLTTAVGTLGQIVRSGDAQNPIFSLADTGVLAATYGSSTTIPVITIDAQGRITSATTTSISAVLASSDAFIQGGNSFGTSATIGTNDNQHFIFETNGLERMRIHANGRVGIGELTPNARLHVRVTSGIPVARFSNTSGDCDIDPTTTSLICSSDRTLKKDIVSMQSTLQQVMKLKPSTFRWNNEDVTEPMRYGFIAQEIEEVFPDFVTTNADTGIKAVAFGNLVPVSVKAIQDINVALGDLSAETTPDQFALSTIYKRFADTFKALVVAFKEITADKATVQELCLPKSDGTVICLTGDQVAQIAASAGVSTTPIVPVPVVEEEVTPEPTPVDPTPVDPAPVEDSNPIEDQGSPEADPEIGVQPESVVEEVLVPEVQPTPEVAPVAETPTE